jgi:putative hydrolase of HD superfamily
MQEQGFPEVHNVVQFVLEIDKLKGVLRKVKPLGGDRYENTAEHSWQIAVFALSLARTLRMPVDA